MSRQEKLAALASTGVTKAELDNIDGGTARGTTAIADGDGVLINDAGTMRMTSVETMATYMGTKIGGGMEFIASSGAISNAASVSFTQFDASKYDHYQFFFQYVIPDTADVKLVAHASTDGGSSYDTTNGNYHIPDQTDQNGFNITQPVVGSGTNEFGVSGEVTLYAPHLTTYTYMRASPIFMHRAGAGRVDGVNEQVSVKLEAADVDAIQFAFSSGNIESGEITMFGIVNS
jgi:hypothetical protein